MAETKGGGGTAPQSLSSFSLVPRVQTFSPLQIKAFLLVCLLCLLAESAAKRDQKEELPHCFTPAEAAGANRR